MYVVLHVLILLNCLTTDSQNFVNFFSSLKIITLETSLSNTVPWRPLQQQQQLSGIRLSRSKWVSNFRRPFILFRVSIGWNLFRALHYHGVLYLSVAGQRTVVHSSSFQQSVKMLDRCILHWFSNEPELLSLPCLHLWTWRHLWT